MPKQGYSDVVIYTPVYEKIKRIAKEERRPIIQQLAVIVDQWLEQRPPALPAEETKRKR